MIKSCRLIFVCPETHGVRLQIIERESRLGRQKNESTRVPQKCFVARGPMSEHVLPVRGAQCTEAPAGRVLTQIFVLHRFPNRLKVFSGLSQPSLVRLQYLFHRYGKIASFGERAMSSKIANIDVVDNLLRMGCNTRADDDWLYWKACRN